MPKVGETIFGQNLKNAAGGKGANQAVAAKRCGAEVTMIGKIGSDSSGELLLKNLRDDSINTSHINIDTGVPTGTALITVNEQGNNSIIVVPGANMAITHADISNASKAIQDSNIIMTQFETPFEAAIAAFKLAKSADVMTILNPAPAKDIPEELLCYTDLIVPNETEAYELTGINVENLEDAKKAAEVFTSKGVKYVIITLAERGAALLSKDRAEIIPAYKVKAIDTTAAGDSFLGALSSRLNTKSFQFEDLIDAVKFGNKVSSIVVQREGAQPSIPYLSEINTIYMEE